MIFDSGTIYFEVLDMHVPAATRIESRFVGPHDYG